MGMCYGLAECLCRSLQKQFAFVSMAKDVNPHHHEEEFVKATEQGFGCNYLLQGQMFENNVHVMCLVGTNVRIQ